MQKVSASTYSHESEKLIFVEPEVEAEFRRWEALVADEPAIGRFSVTARDVLRAHFLLADHFRAKREGIGGVGPKSLHLLHSSVSRQSVSYRGAYKWNSLPEVAATLFFGIIRNHPFHDANKRTALLTALYQLQCHGRTPGAPAKEFEELTERVAERSLQRYTAYESCVLAEDPDVAFIARFFKRKTREVDKRHYVVTYRQLDRLLRRFGAYLGNPHDNTLDVMQERVETRFFIRRTLEQRVLQIGFHDWGAEVSRAEVDRVRKALRLTHERGIDSKVFFQGIDPLESLITEYRAPLERLAYK